MAEATCDGQQWTGVVLGYGPRHVGAWSASFERDGFLDVVIKPTLGEMVRLATDADFEQSISPDRPSLQPNAQEPWYVRVLQKFRGDRAQRKLDIFGRLQWLHPYSASEFQFVEETGVVLGEPTSTYELDVSDMLAELELASDFASFKIVLETGDSNKIAAILEPLDSLPEGVTPPMVFEIRLLGSDGTSLSHRPIRMVPGGATNRSKSIPLARELDLEHFNGQVKLVAFEKPPNIEVDSDA